MRFSRHFSNAPMIKILGTKRYQARPGEKRCVEGYDAAQISKQHDVPVSQTKPKTRLCNKPLQSRVCHRGTKHVFKGAPILEPWPGLTVSMDGYDFAILMLLLCLRVRMWLTLYKDKISDARILSSKIEIG